MARYRAPQVYNQGVMIDIETMAQTPDAVIAAIGAVKFPFDVRDPMIWLAQCIETKDYFYKVVNLEMQTGRVIEGSTVKWWLKQADGPRLVLAADETPALASVLHAFLEWYPQGNWAFSKGASFDLVILEHAFKQAALPVPWDYNQGLCARTVFELSGVGRPKVDILNGHNALDDALLQAVWFQRAIAELRLGWSPYNHEERQKGDDNAITAADGSATE